MFSFFSKLPFFLIICLEKNLKNRYNSLSLYLHAIKLFTKVFSLTGNNSGAFCLNSSFDYNKGNNKQPTLIVL